MGPLRIVARGRDTNAEDLAYWLSKTPEERVCAVEFLRRQCLLAKGQVSEPRLEKVLRVVSRQA